MSDVRALRPLAVPACTRANERSKSGEHRGSFTDVHHDVHRLGRVIFGCLAGLRARAKHRPNVYFASTFTFSTYRRLML